MKKLAPVLLALSLIGCSGPSQEEIRAASNACKEFIAEEMGPRGKHSVETKVFDVWEKRGAIVVEVGYRKIYTSGSYSVRKCIYDEKKGRLSSPSPLSDSEWNK
jgi:hypothetical protein